MKLVANLKLKPTPEQERDLRATLERCNEACNWQSANAWDAKVFRQYDLQRAFYRELRERFGLTAQVAIQCIKKVADAYKIDQKKVHVFRKHAAQPYDGRILRFAAGDAVSIWLLSGRSKVAYTCGDHQRKLMEHRKGEVDLMLVRGKWYLTAVCDFDDPALLTPEGVLGVDFGIVNLATDSMGQRHDGAEVEAKRQRYAKRRATLQKVGTRAARRRLKKISGRQRRYQQIVNHTISKAIVSKAERYSLSIALEELTHIRSRVKANKEQRKRLHNWAFGHLRACIEYKAKRAGIPVIAVDPRNTSRQCPACGLIDKRNRPSQSVFRCVGCEHTQHADDAAAGNIASRGAVTRPMFAHQSAPGAVESPVL